ncbi:hypothetical protein [uncultured Mucilaginibacter sp.]|uniref:hypothetical protein n=1 Tax=uncultured Mucilaginibacter sp. TaxID=797541 RepID=UPI0025F756AC|nr:hypothetical protein [uncultured Mucilaginibacter sp.]
MIVFEVKTTRNTSWDLELRSEIKQMVSIANDPTFGSGDISNVVNAVNNWMQNRKRDTTGAIWMSYKLVWEGARVAVYNINLNGEVKRTVGIIRKEEAN